MISFIVPGDAVPWARAGSQGKRRFTPPKQRSYEGAIKTFASAAMDGDPPMKGPIQLIIRAEYLVPKSWSAKKQAAAEWKASKPDADNIAKAYKDAMNKIVFEDDAQVAHLIVQKKYSIFSRVTVSVMELS
jgi:Holliday junction resolvase RusA-like endonuclease